MPAPHRPVLLAEALQALHPRSGAVYVDGTLGAAGHAAAILEASSPRGFLLGLDRDAGALALAAERLGAFAPDRYSLVENSFDRLGQELARLEINAADGILLDLGVSSMQLDQAQRGFSFRHDAPLDMRMGGDGPTAADVVAAADKQELTRIFKHYGEEQFASRIAGFIIDARADQPVDTTGRLASLVERALPAAERRKRKIHPATKVFQALRLAVNDELGRLERFLENVAQWLNPGGVLAVISYHSLEDRRVKQALARMANPCTCPPRLGACVCGRLPLFDLPRKKAISPSPDEVQENPRARSAKMRVAVRTEVAA